jgi:hypothetical protein
MLASIGAPYLVLEILDFFSIFTKDKHSLGSLGALLVILYALYTRRPVTRVQYKLPYRDVRVEVASATCSMPRAASSSAPTPRLIPILLAA